jgi:predicted metal-dependent hydrolase
MIEENYIEAKKHLENLRIEGRSLSTNLSAAAAAGNGEELVRIKGRERDLPTELFAAQVMLLRSEIEKLETAQAESYRKLQQAKEDSREVDKVVSMQIEILTNERTRLNNQALTALTLPRIIEEEISQRSRDISKTKKELTDLLSSTS